MKRTVPMLLVSVGLAFASSSAFALGDCKTGTGLFCTPNGGGTGQTPVSAPEIDAGSGARAIAILVASLLLVGEGLRRRRG